MPPVATGIQGAGESVSTQGRADARCRSWTEDADEQSLNIPNQIPFPFGLRRHDELKNDHQMVTKES